MVAHEDQAVFVSDSHFKSEMFNLNLKINLKLNFKFISNYISVVLFQICISDLLRKRFCFISCFEHLI